LKKSTKKLLRTGARSIRKSRSQNRQKFFASFFQKRRPSFLCSITLGLIWPAAAGADVNVLHYTARLRGVPLLDITYCLRLDAGRYAAAISARTLGLAEMLVHGRAAGHVAGTIDGSRVKPAAYAEYGRLSGQDYVVVIDYPDGNPVLRLEKPPQIKDRLPIPPADLPGAIDGLSAITLETLVATQTGACQGQALVYDGHQLRRGTTQTAGREPLKLGAGVPITGPALKCQTESVMLAGFKRGDPVASQSKPRHSTAWLGPVVAGGPDLPLRLVFDADFLGDIIVDADTVSHVPTAACGGL
jgi:hypothetical protein